MAARIAQLGFYKPVTKKPKSSYKLLGGILHAFSSFRGPSLFSALKGYCIVCFFLLSLSFEGFSQVPTLSYSSPHTYTTGIAITPLVPASSGVAAPAYNNSLNSLGSGLFLPLGLAADAAGNIYVADYNSIKLIHAGGATETIYSGGARGITVDAAGNIYVASGSTAIKIPQDGSSPINLNGFDSAIGIAVDAAGNIYVDDYGVIIKIPANGFPRKTIGSGFGPSGIALDAAGNLYAADQGNNAVKKIAADGSSTITIASGFSSPSGVAVDAAGNVFVADQGNNAVKMIPAAGGPTIILASDILNLAGVAVDGAGNIYVNDINNRVIKQIKPIGGYYISPALPNGLSFDNSTGTISGTPIAITPTTNYTVTAYNITGVTSANVGIQTAAFGSFAESGRLTVTQQADTTAVIQADNLTVHQGLSPNGDGINDVFTVDGLSNYPDNRVTIMNRNGAVVYEIKGYDNGNKAFDGHSNKTGAMQQPGTYFYLLEYHAGKVYKRYTGYLVLKY
jgi:gliding motility-associated-like protein